MQVAYLWGPGNPLDSAHETHIIEHVDPQLQLAYALVQPWVIMR